MKAVCGDFKTQTHDLLLFVERRPIQVGVHILIQQGGHNYWSFSIILDRVR